MKRGVLCFMLFFCSALQPIIIEQRIHSNNSLASLYADYLLAEFCIADNNASNALPILEGLTKHPLIRNNCPFVDNCMLRALYKMERFSDIVSRKIPCETHPEIGLLYAESLIKTGREKEACSFLSKIVAKNPFLDEAVYLLVVVLSEQKRADEGLAVLEKFLSRENLYARHALFYFLQAKLFVDKNDLAKAHESLQRSVEVNPAFEKGWLLSAVLYQQENKNDEAIACYKKCMELVVDNVALYQQYLSLLFKQERFQEAYEELQKRPAETDEYYCNKALLEWKLDKANDSLKNCNCALQKNNSCTKAKILKIELLAQLKQYSELMQFMRSWLLQEKDNPLAHLTFMGLAKKGVSLSLLSSILKKIGEQNLSTLTLGALADLFLEQNDFNNAEQCYQKLLSMTHDALLKSKLYFLAAYCNFKSGNLGKVEEPLKQSLITGEVFHPAYNLLAYYYATKGANLSYALELVEAALKKEENNSDFLDTKGYILVRMGNHKAAMASFDKALRKTPNNKIILEHLSLVQ